MSGPAVAARLAASRPDMKVLYMSGYIEGAIAHHGVLEPGGAYLPKPFTIDSLTGKVRAVLDGDDAPHPPITVAWFSPDVLLPSPSPCLPPIRARV